MVPFIDTAACGTTETVDDVELDEIVFRSGSSKVEPLSTTNEEACNEAQLGNCTAEGEGGSCSSKTKVVSESEDPSDEQPLLMGSPNDAVEMKLDEKCDCNGCNTPPVGAGLVLDYVQHWMVFTKIPEMFILVPALLGLKGNLEMTLASRLSTMANMGLLDNQSERSALLVANLCLIETQANVISLFASFLAILLRWITNGEVIFVNIVVLIASSMSTGISASFFLSLVMISVILLCRYFGINPDNVATPIAASLGDLVTLTMLAYIGSFYLLVIGRPIIVCTLIIFGLIALLPVCFLGSWKNKDTKEVVLNGFSPIICSMLISSGSGFILGRSVTQFKGIAVFQPIINGIGGNLVAIQASRISTYLHKNEKLGKVASYLRGRQAANPFWVFFGKQPHITAAWVLVSFVGPGHAFFALIISFLNAGHTTVSLKFMLFYLGAAYVQVFILLYFCFVGVHMLWKWKMNPDDIAIPYLTALGDFLGTLLLYICFYIMSSLGDHDADVGD
ncbi:Solute carrier family 41 member [Trichinella spiralis]|uniref:Solute carrier family 41 member n=1 Tax=Trichinella spiralis TaxID=6334 RepID=A0ABR3KYC3_TRISP